MKPEIKNIDSGIAFCVCDGNKKWIEINKNLNKKKYKKLKSKVLKHEMLHWNSPNKHIDFLIDFKDIFHFRKHWELAKFGIRHPKSLMSESPIFYENRRWSVNWFMVGVWSVVLSLAIGGILIM